MFAAIAIGFVFATAAAGLALMNGSGLLLALLAYAAGGALAMLVPLVWLLVAGTDETDAGWELDSAEGSRQAV